MFVHDPLEYVYSTTYNEYVYVVVFTRYNSDTKHVHIYTTHSIFDIHTEHRLVSKESIIYIHIYNIYNIYGPMISHPKVCYPPVWTCWWVGGVVVVVVVLRVRGKDMGWDIPWSGGGGPLTGDMGSCYFIFFI